MAPEDSTGRRPVSRGWGTRAPAGAAVGGPYRFAFRLIGIPALAVAAVLIYTGLRERFVLPECDSSRARNTLTDVFKQLDVKPLRFEPISTVSSSKDEVVCKALLPLPDGGELDVDYRFFWQGSSANMKYSITRKPPPKSTAELGDHPAAGRGYGLAGLR